MLCAGSICTRAVHFPDDEQAVLMMLFVDFSLPQRCRPRVLTQDRQHAAFGGSRVPRAAVFCVALTYSTVRPASQEAMLDSV